MTDNDHAQVAIFPPFAFAIALIAGAGLQLLEPMHFLQPFGFGTGSVIGAILIAASVVIVGAALRAFRAAGTGVDVRTPSLVVATSGPYRFSRNPMYLSMLMLVAGLALAFSVEWLLVAAPALWAVLHFGAVLREEAYLEAKFGDEYRALLSHTRRWL